MIKDLNCCSLCNPFYQRPWMRETGAAGTPHGKGVKGVIAGGLTGAIECCISYPTEYIKTQLQLDVDSQEGKKQYTGIMDVIKKTIKNDGIFGMYKGLSILIYGSVPKAGIRFGTFEFLKQLTQDEYGHISSLNTFMNGLGAGCAESIFAVTPMETIKVRMVNDRRLPQPRFTGMFQGVSIILKEEGIKGVYKGVVPTTIKQGTSQAIRFFIVERLKDWWRGGDPTKAVPVYVTPFFGVLGGTASACANMPIDVVKTKMQGLDAQKYKGTWDCIKKIYQMEGPMGFYKGLIPRVIRVSIDVAVTFTLYDSIMLLFSKIWPS